MKRWILAAGLVVADQLLKVLAVLYASPGGFFVLAYNTGVTFGFLPGANETMAVVSVGAALLVGHFLLRAKGTDRLAFSLLLAGIVGNGIDRVARGAVVDYVRIGSFPVFNLADALIVTGVSILLLEEVLRFRTRRTHRARRGSRSREAT